MSELRVEMRIVEVTPRDEQDATTYYRDDTRTLAEFDVVANIGRAFSVYQQALTDLCRPEVLLLPDGLSAEEAERVRADWMKRRA